MSCLYVVSVDLSGGDRLFEPLQPIVDAAMDCAARGDIAGFHVQMQRRDDLEFELTEALIALNQTGEMFEILEKRIIAIAASRTGEYDVDHLLALDFGRPREAVLAVMRRDPDAVWRPELAHRQLEAFGFEGTLGSVQANMRRMATDGEILKVSRGSYRLVSRGESNISSKVAGVDPSVREGCG
jgi:hypothetical protein